MKICKGVEALDLALKVDSCLIISDVHIGYEEALNRQGILIPRFQFPEIIKRLDKIFCSCKKKFSKIIINGDLKHDFGIISEQEWRNVLKIIDFLHRHCGEIVIIKGNHDSSIGQIADKRGVKVAEKEIIQTKYGKILVTHGDKLPQDTKEYSVIIIGHEHPAISLRNGQRAETYKCYPAGKYKKSILVVQPSLNPVNEGTDIMKEKLLSPFLRQNLDDFSVFVVEDKIYDFGKLKNLRNHKLYKLLYMIS